MGELSLAFAWTHSHIFFIEVGLRAFIRVAVWLFM